MKTFKKLFAFSAIFALLATLLPTYAFGASYSAELEGAYDYAKGHGITTMDSIENADMYGSLTRVAMAKMMANYSMDVLGLTPDTTMECNFPDVSEPLNAQYDNGVTNACQLGLMGVGITNFNPYGLVTRAEFGTVLSRAMYGEENNGGNPYYADHLAALKDAGIMTQISNPMQLEVRGYVMLMMQRASDDSSTSGCTAEELLACITADNYDECIAACSDAEDVVDTTVKAGDLKVTVADYSTAVKSVPMVGISIFNSIKFAASESITVKSITLERVGLSSRSDIKGVWFERDGVSVSSRGTVATDGKVTTNFNRGFSVKANETLDLVVEFNGANAGSEIAFKIIGVDSTAKNATYDVTTTTYRTANYTVAKLGFSNVGGIGLVNYKLGNQTDFVVGEFRVNNQAAGDDKDVFVKSVTFRNNGSADLNSLLKNVKVMRDNKDVSKSIIMDGRNITLVLEDTIAAGKNANYVVRAEVAALDRIGDTVQLELRKNTDFVAYEKSTNFRTSMQNASPSTAWTMKEYKFEGGRVILTNTSGFPKNIDAGTGANDVVIADGKLAVSEPVRLPTLTLNTTTQNALRSLVLEIDGSRYSATINTTGDEYVFEDIYVNKDSSVKLIASLSNTPGSSISFTSNLGASAFANDGEYTNNQETLQSNGVAGAVQIAKVTVKEPSFTLKNSASTTQKVVKGESDTKVIFEGTMSAKADINVTEMTLSSSNTTTGQIDLFLYVDDQPVSNATYKATDVVFNNGLGTVGTTPVKVRIEATPTVEVQSDFTFTVNARGTDSNGNDVSSTTVNTVKLSIVDNASVSIANAATTSSITLEGSNAELTKFKLTAKDGSVNAENLTINFAANGLSGTSVTLELADDTHQAVVVGSSVAFNNLNINLLEGGHDVVVKADINTDGITGGVKEQVSTVVVDYDGTTYTGNLGAKYYFVKGYPTLSLVKSSDNELRVRITNGGTEDIKIIGYTATNAITGATTLNGQVIADSGFAIDPSKQVTIAAGQSTELKLSVASGIAKLTGIKYEIVDGSQTYVYDATDEYTNNATWGDLMVTYKS